MAIPDYRKYLAENVLNERRTVTYRALGRVFRVHSSLAKQMLYDFHHQENTKKPNSVNATYIITGIPKAPETSGVNGASAGSKDNNGDVIMPSSPYIPSSMPDQDLESSQVPVSAVVLAREEDMEGKASHALNPGSQGEPSDARSAFNSISTIYIYSLQPAVLQDLNVLTDVTREMLANHTQEDPLEYGNQWGMIQNKNVKQRRTGARAPPPKTTLPAKRPAETEPSERTKPEPKKEEPSELPKPSQRQESTPSSAKPAEKPPLVKKENSNLFSSFAKAKPKQKKEEASTPSASTAESAEPSGTEDVILDDASEDEPEQLFPESEKPAASEPRETRKEREEKLKKMMEDDDEDEEMLDVANPAEEPGNVIDEPPPKQEELKVEASIQGGRRRGRRQVMKKRTVKDEEGYLVTREEATWESFSEDEPVVAPPKKKPAVGAPKGKAGGKPGQGNIMSFFSKK